MSTTRAYAWADRGLVADEPVPTLYQLIWSRLAATGLADIRTIYYAPTGVLHRLNLGAIAVNDEQVLSDVYQLIEVSSTRRLVEDRKIPSARTMPQAWSLAVVFRSGYLATARPFVGVC